MTKQVQLSSLQGGISQKPKRAPSAYNLFVKEGRKSGLTMAECAQKWREKKGEATEKPKKQPKVGGNSDKVIESVHKVLGIKDDKKSDDLPMKGGEKNKKKILRDLADKLGLEVLE